MCFKILSVALMAACLSGCGIHLFDKYPAQQPVNLTGNYGCVSKIPEHVDLFVSDQMSLPEISEYMGCLQKAFASFAQMTRGREEASYTPDEVRRFVQTYFLKDRVVSDELLHQLMQIKTALVGGSNTVIARTELYAIVGILNDVRTEAIRLKPHIKYLNPKLAALQPPGDVGQHLNDANKALRESAQVFTKRLQSNQVNYSLADLTQLLDEVRDFAKWDPERGPNVAQWVALFRSFKDVTVSPLSPDAVAPGEWQPLLNQASGWYLRYLQYKVGIKNQPVLQGVGLQNALLLAQGTFNLTKAAIANQPSKTISFEQLDNLIVALHDVGWIPSEIRTSSIDQSLRAVVTRVEGDGAVPPALRSTTGVNLQALANLESQFYRWAYVQVNLNQQFPPAAKDDANVPNMQSEAETALALRLKINALKSSDWDEFLQVKTLIRPLFANAQNRVFLVPSVDLGQFSITHGFYNLSVMNIVRSLAAMVFRGYAQDNRGQAAWTSGISAVEMQKFYSDMRELGIDLGWLDKRNYNSGTRAFVEGKLFTYASTGLDDSTNELSFVEAMEYFTFLYSGGEVADDIFKGLSKLCGAGPMDINGTAKLDRQCVQDHLPEMFQEHMTNMPFLLDYLAHTSKAKQQNYFKAVLDSTYSSNSEPEWVERDEITTLAVIVHYAETVLTRFDKNGDGKLSNDEIEIALPVFSGFIKKVAASLNLNFNDEQARAAFYYILAYKMLPTRWVDLPFIWKNEYVSVPDLNLDRNDLAEVFKAIIVKLVELGKKQ